MSPRLLLIILLVATIAAGLALTKCSAIPTATDPTAKPPAAATPTPAAATVATATPAQSEDAAARSVAPLDPAAPVFTVDGQVFGDPRLSIAGAEVVAYAGEPGDRGGISQVFGLANQPRRDSRSPFVVSGPALARVMVAADGSFSLRTNRKDLRLFVEHDCYGLPTPEVVHVPAVTRTAIVVLTPELGGCIHGRLFGTGIADVKGIRLAVQPDPMLAMSKLESYLGAIVRAMAPPVTPAADGTFRFRAVTPGSPLTLIAESTTSTGRSSQPALEPGERREVALPLTVAATLTVRVVDADGKAMAGAQVAALPADAAEGATVTRELAAIRGKTVADGTVTLLGIGNGLWHVRASAKDYRSASVDVAVPATGPVTIALARGATIRGVVTTRDGKPIEGARAAAMPSLDVPFLGDMSKQLGGDALTAIADDGPVTDAEGRFELTGIADEGSNTVVAAHADYATGIASNVASGATDVRIALDPHAGVRARVLAAENGSPLPQFTIELRQTMFAVLERPVRTELVTAAADGNATLRNVAPGDYTLAARAEDRSETSVQIKVTVGSEPEPIELRLAPSACITGRIVDTDGKPIRGALVQRSRGGLRDNPVLAMFGADNEAVRSDATGSYRLGNVPPGKLQLMATADGFASGRSDRIEVTAGTAIADVVITLDHGGAISGRLRTARGDPADEYRLFVQSETTQRTTPCRIAADGTFKAENLDPGRYQVQAMHPSTMRLMQRSGAVDPGQQVDIKGMMSRMSEGTVSQRCVVAANATTEVELDATDLGSGTRLSLQITVGDAPLDHGMVEGTLVEDGRVRMAFVDHGEAVFPALRPGQLRVQVRTGLTMAPIGAPQLIDVPAGTDSHRAVLELPGGELAGRVLDEAGNPLGSVLVRLLRGSGADEDVFGTAVTDTDGQFVFRALQADTYGIVAADVLVARSASGSASRLDGIRLAAGERRRDLELRSQPAVGATVNVTDADGHPVGGAMVLAVDPDGRPLGNFALAVAGNDGRAHLGGLPRGALRIAGRAAGLAPDVSAAVDSQPGQSLEITLRLQRGVRVALEARAADGSPLPGATVRARCNRGPWLPSLLLLENNGAGGRFELGRLCPGEWEFAIDHPSSGPFTVTRTIQDGAAMTILCTPGR